MRGYRLKYDSPEKIHIQLVHVRQKHNWDCGISCVLMVLTRKQRQHFLNNFSRICNKEGFDKSTWTIDLCYLLKKFKIKHFFCTTTLGVHEGHRTNSFYTNVLNKDENRVNKKFKQASNHGIVVKKSCVSLQDILNHLVKGPIIVLTNAKLLTCDVCKLNKISMELRKCIPWPVSYQGHYVVLCGYDIKTEKFFYRNPSFNEHVCVMSFKVLEEARKSPGTDEDIIFLYT